MSNNSLETAKEVMPCAPKSAETSQISSSLIDPGMLETLNKPVDTSKISLLQLAEIWDTSLREDILTRTDTPKYPIGLKSLDEILWGLHKKEMMAIGARTSQGKSAFSLFLTKQLVEKGNRVIYFSLEMSKEQLLERFLTQVALINNIRLRKGQAKQEMLDNETFFRSWMDTAKLLIDDKYGYNFDTTMQVIELIKPDFVILDYIQMVSAKGFKGKMEAVEEYVRRLKELANEMNFGAIVVSQVNRTGVEGAEMHHLKWAGVLEEHPDTVIMLKWDWSVGDPGKFVIDVKKQRHGEVKNGIIINFIPQHSLFEEVSGKVAKKLYDD